MKLQPVEIWFVTGSQHLYGPETLAQVAEHSSKIVEALNATARIPLPLVFKPDEEKKIDYTVHYTW